MGKQCSEPGCDRPIRARGLCRRHYNSRWYQANPRPKKGDRRARKRVKKPTCQHFDCRRSAVVRFTLPYPILRREIACRAHAQPLLGSFVPGITVEDI